MSSGCKCFVPVSGFDSEEAVEPLDVTGEPSCSVKPRLRNTAVESNKLNFQLSVDNRLWMCTCKHLNDNNWQIK